MSTAVNYQRPFLSQNMTTKTSRSTYHTKCHRRLLMRDSDTLLVLKPQHCEKHLANKYIFITTLKKI